MAPSTAETIGAPAGKTWPDDLYVAGFLQGGHATSVISRELEALDQPNWNVRASAAIAGAYDLRNIAFPFAMKGPATDHAVYLTLLAQSNADMYGKPVDSLLTPQCTQISNAFVLDRDTDAALKRLPADPNSLFRPDFLVAYDAGLPHWFLEVTQDNSIASWALRSPCRACYGEADRDGPPEKSNAVAKRAQELGGDATAI
jgi:hypothetical protein